MSSLGYAVQSFQGQDTVNNNGDGSQGNYTIDYNGYTFNLHTSGVWILTLGNSQFAFMNLPNAVEGINTQLNPVSSYSGKPLYISSESLDAEAEIYRNLDGVVLRRQYACLEGETCKDESFPIKTCDDNFIIIKEDNLGTIIQENNCVYILGPKEDLTKLTDEFLYKIIGVEY